ncbi:MAG: NUDIX domain-containing protein [Candidatus Parcubacteria bacterium]|nr:NUDIX domain-containing protein [Candidatus Parcubacteria bacterium]
MKIPTKLYKKIINVLPILCVDAIVINEGKFLLVKRKNKPKKGSWWVPGGRILRGETAETALHRKIKEELGIRIKALKCLGYYEYHFKENNFGGKNGIHTLSIVFLAKPLSLDVILDSQGSSWKFSKTLPKDFIIKPFKK